MESKTCSVCKCALTGLLAGFINGFFGAGGGMLVVPLLTGFVGIADKAAFSSAIAIILPMSLVSLVIYLLTGSVDLHAAASYLLGGAVGGILAGIFFQKVPARALHLALGALILIGGVRLMVC